MPRKQHPADRLAGQLDKDTKATFDLAAEGEGYRKTGGVTRPLSKRAAKLLRQIPILETERDILIESCDEWQGMFRQQADEIDKLRADIARYVEISSELDADAGRYRFLRAQVCATEGCTEAEADADVDGEMNAAHR